MGIQEFADEALRTFLSWEPMSASLLGLHDLGLDGQLADWSEEHAEEKRATLRAMQQRLDEEFDPTDMPLQERVTRDMLARDIGDRLDLLGLAPEEFAVAPFYVGAQAQLLQFLPKTQTPRADLAEARLERLAAIPRMLDQAARRLATGVEKGRTPPARAARAAVAQIEGYLGSDIADDLLIGEAPEELDDAEAWRDRATTLVREEVRPAFARFRDHVRDVVAPAGRSDDEPGVVYLPDGADVYRVAARHETSTDRTPDEIHQLGLDLVAELDEEYAELAPRVLGTGDRREVFDRMRTDPQLRYDTREQMLADAEKAVRRATEEAETWFGTTPQTPCVVRAVGEHEETDAPPAYYTPPATDGSRPGTYWLNTRGPETRQRYLSESIAFHEAIPGHHFQIALAQQLEGLPGYRRLSTINAYAEGWGLYAERLADEIGLYSSDLMRLGMLATDSWRICRLVVDTGLHHLGWSRQRAIDWMTENSPVDPATIEVEIDRYIAMPGQALGYMVGRIEIVRLREDARRRLGDAFDIRGFHDTLLGSGSLPLSTLGLVVDAWVEGVGRDVGAAGDARG